MAETQTAEAQPDNEQDKSEKTTGTDGASTPVSPEARKRILDKHHGKEQNATDTVTPEVREKIRKELVKESGKYEETPWQKMRHNVAPHAKTAAKTGLFLANPIVYGTVYGADWLAQRTPGVKNLYAAPREIIRSTADKAMNVLVGGATLLPALPQTVGHEISDKLHGMDTSKPKNAIGWAIDKTGDVVGGTLGILKAGFGKTVEAGKHILPEIVKGIGAILTAPAKLIGSMYKGLSQVGGITGFLGQLALTTVLVTGGHAAITAGLAAASPAAAGIYTGFVNTLLQALGSLF